MDITEADLAESLKFVFDTWDCLEELEGFFGGHLENFVNVFATVADFQGFGVIAHALASFAGHVNVWEEVHFDLFDTVTRTFFTAAAFDVEREASGLVSTSLGFWSLGEEVADVGEDAGVGGWVGARGATNRRLVDTNDFVEVIETLDLFMSSGHGF